MEDYQKLLDDPTQLDEILISSDTIMKHNECLCECDCCEEHHNQLDKLTYYLRKREDELKRITFWSINRPGAFKTQLSFSCLLGLDESVMDLLYHGVNVNEPINKKSSTRPIHILCYINHASLLALLLTREEILLNVNDSMNGWTPLMIGCKYRHKRIVSMLLKKGANPDIRCKWGIKKAIDFAKGSPEIVSMIKGHKISKNKNP